jgi:hypothetical protein
MVWWRKKSVETNNRDQRYINYPLFKDESVQRDIETKGYASGGIVLNSEDIAALYKVYERFLEFMNYDIGEQFLASGCVNHPEMRKYVLDNIYKVTGHKIARLVNEEIGWVAPAIFQIKPSSPISESLPHQDDSVVDETKYYGVYAWISLEDSTIDNGCLWMLPGSHKLGNKHRSLTVPKQFTGYWDIVKKYAVNVPAKAGEVIFFDNAIMHGSLTNMSGHTRVALTNVVLPKEAQVITHFMDEATPKDKVEVYAVTEDFWNNCDILKRPPSQFPFLGYKDFSRINMTAEEFERFIRKNLK